MAPASDALPTRSSSHRVGFIGLPVRRPRPIDRTPIEAQIGEIKAFYGIREHCLETLLAEKRSVGRSAVTAGA